MKRPALWNAGGEGTQIRGCVHNLKRVWALKGGGAAVLVFVCLQLCPSVALSFCVSIFLSISMCRGFCLCELLAVILSPSVAAEQRPFCVRTAYSSSSRIPEHLKHTFLQRLLNRWTYPLETATLFTDKKNGWGRNTWIKATIIPVTWIVGANWSWNMLALATVAGAISFTTPPARILSVSRSVIYIKASSQPLDNVGSGTWKSMKKPMFSALAVEQRLLVQMALAVCHLKPRIQQPDWQDRRQHQSCKAKQAELSSLFCITLAASSFCCLAFILYFKAWKLSTLVNSSIVRQSSILEQAGIFVNRSSMGARFVNGSSMGARFVNIDEQVSGIDELLTNQYGRIDELLTNWRTIRNNWRLDELLPNHWRTIDELTNYWRTIDEFPKVLLTSQSKVTWPTYRQSDDVFGEMTNLPTTC